MSFRGRVVAPLLWPALATAVASCNALWGLDELDVDGVAGASAGSGGGAGECALGFADCDGDPQTACEDTQTDVDHCGACQASCSLEQASSASCVSGHCVFQCSSGYEDCDGLGDNGCESELSSDAHHCGACDAACPTDVNAPLGGVPCDSGACVYPASCKAIHGAFPNAPSAVYRIDADGAAPTAPFDAYCDMTAAGGGWTLALKCDGKQPTFKIDAALWTNADTYNPDAPGFDLVEAKLESFFVMPFTELRLVMIDPGDMRERALVLKVSGTSLADSFSKEIVTTAPKTGWLGLLNKPSTQENCNMQGFNRVEGGNYKARLGLAMNNEQASCSSCDTWIGFGLDIGSQGDQASCGNFGEGNPGTIINGNQNKRAFGYILLR